MINLQFTAQQYKQMTFTTLKDKFIPFSIGLCVTIITLSTIVVSFPKQMVNQFVHATEQRIITSFYFFQWRKAPTISSLDIEKILASNTMNGGGNVQTALTPTQTVNPTETPFPTSTPWPTMTPLPTQVVENGDISAISSKRVTFKGDTYTVQQGEGLYEIAEKVYGDGMMWTAIAEANKLSSPDLIEVGMKLKIPKKK